jgi:hypothetical protein
MAWSTLNEIRELDYKWGNLILGMRFNLRTVGEKPEPRIFRSFTKMGLGRKGFAGARGRAYSTILVVGGE